MPRALISVADKTGVDQIAWALHKAGIEIISTGGTLKSLRDAGIPATPVDEITRFPELFDGRVKTLHPAIHGGIMFRRDLAEHHQQAVQYGIEPIDVLICNLYPFEATINQPGVTDEGAIENIDIGGPAMIRAAAKNHQHVAVVVDPDDYKRVTSIIAEHGIHGLDQQLKRELAARAFEHSAAYDSLIASWMSTDRFPGELTLTGRRLASLRYGENPHQQAAVYEFPGTAGLHGIGGWALRSSGEMSYNNYLDATAAWGAVCEFDSPAAVIVKHSVPCGVAVDTDIVAAFERALAGDPVSAFGGVIALNRPVSEELAIIIARRKYDVLLAPGFDEAASERLEKRKGLRLLDTLGALRPGSQDYRIIPGGILAQTTDLATADVSTWSTVTNREPTADELDQLAFAWSVVKHVKSNAIVLGRENGTVGVCGGQPNRVDSVRMAIERAGDRATGSVLASDAFFPFADGVEEAVRAGVTAIAQPGGSTRDSETIAAANDAGAAMVFTGIRHFRH
ncbi:MAG: bifunctional phosphoribosylaminoimidazolecarboxamide formyltransferase/IMP cyclohydrolase [Thermomicrobiaceae bacterium]